MKLYSSNKNDNNYLNIFFNYKKSQKSNFIKNNKKFRNNCYNRNNITESNKKKFFNDSAFSNSKSKVSNNNSFNNSLLINLDKNTKKIKKDNSLNNKNISVNGINNSKKILYLKNNFQEGYNNNYLKPKQSKLINETFNNNKVETFFNGINIINYNNIIPNIKNGNNNIKDFSGETNISNINNSIYNSSNYNNSNINSSSLFNISSIDHLFCKQIKKKSSLHKNRDEFMNKMSSNISPINNSKKIKNNFSKKKFKKLNTSYSIGKSNKKMKIFNDIKTFENSFRNKIRNNSALNLGNNKINTKNNINLKYNEIERNYKKTMNNFQPKNIFSKYRNKKNKSLNQEDLLKNILLIKNNENKKKVKKLNYNNFINDLDSKKRNINKYYDENQKIKKKEIKLDEDNNNIYQINNQILFPNLKSKENNQKSNNNNILSSTTLLSGTDNHKNDISNEINNTNSNNTFNFKGKKIRSIHDISKTGLCSDEKKVNQDRYFIFRNFVSGYDNIFMGVLDGHGYFGQEVSEYIKENLPMDLNRILKAKNVNLIKDDLSEIIKQAFVMENNSLLRNRQIDSTFSGSTCVAVIYTSEKLIIMNLGDSRCILGKKINNEYKIENLTYDHKPNVEEEAERIKSYGGRIRAMMDDEGNFVGPLRVYLKDKDIPGLAMTRSFGDYYASTVGTISIPDVTEYKFSASDKFLILASDGLFEFMSNEELLKIVTEYYERNDIVGCSEYLYKESYRKWINEETDIVDDITIILVFLDDL
jgi:serine/threonine protein phosphatase PrpC